MSEKASIAVVLKVAVLLLLGPWSVHAKENHGRNLMGMMMWKGNSSMMGKGKGKGKGKGVVPQVTGPTASPTVSNQPSVSFQPTSRPTTATPTISPTTSPTSGRCFITSKYFSACTVADKLTHQTRRFIVALTHPPNLSAHCCFDSPAILVGSLMHYSAHHCHSYSLANDFADTRTFCLCNAHSGVPTGR